MTSLSIRSVERFLLPNVCVACDRPVGTVSPDALVCSVCVSRLRGLPSGCERCGQPLPPVGACTFCRDWPAELEWARSAVWLGPEARAVLHHLKYDAYPALGAFAAARIVRHVPRPGQGVLVPVPLAVGRLRARGYNQATEIARHLAAAWTLPLLERRLARGRETASQTTLRPEARRRNVSGAFVARSGDRSAPSGALPRIILVDDVLTTGATVLAAAAALIEVGWRRIGCVTFARALPFAERVLFG